MLSARLIDGGDDPPSRLSPRPIGGVFVPCIHFEAGVPETYNAAPAEYVGQAALCIKLGPEIPSVDISAKKVPGFDNRSVSLRPAAADDIAARIVDRALQPTLRRSASQHLALSSQQSIQQRELGG